MKFSDRGKFGKAWGCLEQLKKLDHDLEEELLEHYCEAILDT